MPKVKVKNLWAAQQQIVLTDHTGECLHTRVLGRREEIIVDETEITPELIRKSQAGPKKSINLSPA